MSKEQRHFLDPKSPASRDRVLGPARASAVELLLLVTRKGETEFWPCMPHGLHPQHQFPGGLTP